MSFIQLLPFQTTVPKRASQSLQFEVRDAPEINLVDNPCFEAILNSVVFLLKNNPSFLNYLSKLTVSYKDALQEVFDTAQNMKFCTEYLEHHPLPKIVIQRHLREAFHLKDHVYGIFTPNEPDIFYLEGDLVLALLKETPNGKPTNKALRISFLILVKIIHKLANWLCFQVMKGKRKDLKTPENTFEGEAGIYIETRVFGGIVAHHSSSDKTPWDIDIILRVPKTTGLSNEYFTVAFMQKFFLKEEIECCKHLIDWTVINYVEPIPDPALSVLARVITFEVQLERKKGNMIQSEDHQIFAGLPFNRVISEAEK